MNNIYSSITWRQEEILRDTWGHLAPKPGRKYQGWILVYYAFSGDFGILDWEFEDLDGSPWQQVHFDYWVDMWIDSRLQEDIDPGVYLYQGWYKAFKNGNCQFKVSDFIKQEIGG